MSSRFFTTTATSIALIAVLGGAAFAQDTAESFQIPEVLDALNLNDVEVKDGPRGGTRIEAELPDGGEIMAILDKQNNVMMIKGDDAALPQSVLDQMLPQAVRDNAILSQFAVIDRVAGHEGRAMVAGQDADGEELRAGFDADGRLMRFGRGDEDHGPKHRGKHHRKGGDHDKGERGGMHGKHGDHHRGDHGPEGHRKADGDHHNERAMKRIDSAAIDQKLGDAGYTDLRDPRPAGPRIQLDAVNPAGEAVTLDLDREGDVLREVAR
ncbi:hypothetical protein PAF17_10280 [Paracoccus sp. Z330]|uniref:PepSY domain-containing protein n=1 Tax=Paracoccus onchidii TaxID=3017813 RepID=A0ABT4ZEY0_9RHOB|nr:hypothetical protein [Paracoccus onchidii]MDB6177888.1 hypothetical protein [Paracoccus onchidii]